MYTGKTLFTRIMDYLSWKTFHRIVSRYDGGHCVRTLPCAEHFRALADDVEATENIGSLFDQGGNFHWLTQIGGDKFSADLQRGFAYQGKRYVLHAELLGIK